MAVCCPPGSHPAVTPPADYTPKGRVENIGGTEAYIVGEKSSKGIIVLSDIFGVDSGRTKAICDYYAEKGFFVILPDIFFGKPLHPDILSGIKFIFHIPSLIRFMGANKWQNRKSFYEEAVIPYLREQGVTSIGTVSFCYGAYVAAFLGTNENIKATVCFHSSQLQITAVTREKWAPLYEAAKGPYLMCPSGQEGAALQPGGKIESILKTVQNGSEYLPFKEMKHGWVNRGDIEEEGIRKSVDDALKKSVEFLQEHLS